MRGHERNPAAEGAKDGQRERAGPCSGKRSYDSVVVVRSEDVGGDHGRDYEDGRERERGDVLGWDDGSQLSPNWSL